MSSLESQRASAVERIRACGSLLVALSGGVDSAVLLALGREALPPENLLAVTAESESLPARDLDDARRVARHLDVEHLVVRTSELSVPEYRGNQGDRCFHCRNELFRVLSTVARDRGLAEIAYGAIKDDEGDFRPGMKAAAGWGIRAPLLEAGLTKQAVRELARQAGLPVDSKPAAACLASRIPSGTEVTAQRLRTIEAAEEAVRQLGFRQLRVRHHGELARIELERSEMGRLADPELRDRIVDVVKKAGFRFCTLDLEGYRAGSLNPADPDEGGPARVRGQ